MEEIDVSGGGREVIIIKKISFVEMRISRRWNGVFVVVGLNG